MLSDPPPGMSAEIAADAARDAALLVRAVHAGDDTGLAEIAAELAHPWLTSVILARWLNDLAESQGLDPLPGFIKRLAESGL